MHDQQSQAVGAWGREEMGEKDALAPLSQRWQAGKVKTQELHLTELKPPLHIVVPAQS